MSNRCLVKILHNDTAASNLLTVYSSRTFKLEEVLFIIYGTILD